MYMFMKIFWVVIFYVEILSADNNFMQMTLIVLEYKLNCFTSYLKKKNRKITFVLRTYLLIEFSSEISIHYAAKHVYVSYAKYNQLVWGNRAIKT